MESLERVLAANRPDLERELANAERELDELRRRERTLDALIARARSALGMGEPPPSDAAQAAVGGDGEDHVPLHEALARVLRQGGNRPMTARALADAVNRSGLYRKRDGSAVDPSQVHARVHMYRRLFVREPDGIRLSDSELQTFDPELLARFNRAMIEVYEAALHEVGYAARRFLTMTRRRGGHEAARHLLAKSGMSEGFRRLAEERKFSITMEYQVLRPEFAALFSDSERAVARQRLLDGGMHEDDLV